ncbi:protocadherin alpha-10 isoform X5 [Sorex araneus]|uniref:protocadherin alpha-10 isoform X5 n=1 Tax=Sorex araneus TaxID=42254 RepID=UPI00243397DD|nr:protocadherin alpha-10 isoform X5 [Sorex araneus]
MYVCVLDRCHQEKGRMLVYRSSGPSTRFLLRSLLLLASWETGSGQLHYSVPEEAKHGTFVGRIAQDLGLELADLVPRLFRVASKDRGDLLEVNLQNGILFVNSRIDREELCGRRAECSLHLEVIVDRPLQVFHVEVEVKDINDNPPVFSVSEQKLLIPESRLLDSRFPLEGASDADVGENAMLTYRLSSNEFFNIDIIDKKDKGKFPVLVLKKLLDHEENPQLQLLLTATDGGKPEYTGSVTLLIHVLDVNDNAPTFDRPVYEVKMYENSANQTLVIQLNASDADEGINKEVMYSFSSLVPPMTRRKFLVNERTGEIKINDLIDFEDRNNYEIHVDATDKGNPPMIGHCTVLVEILDENDNLPEVVVTSLALPVKEDAKVGTVIALISVSDQDSGANGQVTCALASQVPFKLVSTFKNHYSLVLESALDRESVSNYQVVVTARDGGSPPLWATASVAVEVSDVNDNAPAFAQPEYTVFVKENNAPGCHIFTVSARDADAQENARVSYSLVERRVGERLLSSYVSVHAESGKVFALQPLDHEELELLRFQVSARDAGVPPLGSNVTLQVFVLDDNDNAPALLPTGAGAGVLGAARSELVARSVGAGHVVAKVRAVDADSGYNAWLSYELAPAAGGARSPFRVGLYTGEISTTRGLDEADAARLRLLVLVKDHGEPALTATATVLLSLVESGQAPKASSRAALAGAAAAGGGAALVDVNVYLIVAICAVSSLLVLTLLLYTALRCSSPAREAACAAGKPALVLPSEVGSWSHSQQRRQRVCSGEGPPKTDLMAFSPSLPPSSTPDVEVEEPFVGGDHSRKPRQPNPDWRYSASLRAGMHSSVHLEEAGILRAGPGGPDQQWPTVSSATPEPEAGEVSPPVGAGVNSNSWTFKYGPGNPKQSGPGELPDKFIIPGSPAIISIRQEPTNSQIDKSDFITFGKKEETKKKKKKKKGNKTQEKKEKGNSTTDNSDQ